MAEPSRLGRRLRYFRGLRGMTQKELARAARVSRPAIANLETGGRQTVQLDTVERLCRALQISIDQLAGFDLANENADDVEETVGAGV